METKDNMDSFVFYGTFLSQIGKLKDEAAQLLAIRDIVRYGCFGEMPDFYYDRDGGIEAMFEGIKMQIDNAKSKRLINQNNGRKGGAPKGNRNAAKQPNSTENNPIQPNSTENNPNDNVYDNDKDNVNGKIGQTAKRFTPPSLEDIQAYCSEMGYSFDPQRFLDFYESKGWMVGKTKMKDWKAALRGWNSRQSEFEFKPQQPPSKDARRGTDVSASSGGEYDGDF